VAEQTTGPVSGGDDTGPRPLTIPRLLGRGLVRRCPLCAGTDCFESYFRMRDRCPRCNLALERVEGHWIGALGMNTIVSFGLLFLTLVGGLVATWPDPPAVPLLVACVTVAAVVPVLFFPFSRTLWSAIDLAMRPLEPRDQVDPRYIPRGTRTRRRRRW
jgi:uncharacterized protein (DUF983 family)